MHIRIFVPSDTEAVIDLWARCGLLRPWNNPHRDIERKLAVEDELFIVGTEESDLERHEGSSTQCAGKIIAVAMGGYDGHRGWVNYLAVDPQRRKAGLGQQLMSDLEERLLALGCAKLNLQVRSDNVEVLQFYQHIGYQVDEVKSMGKRLIPD